MGLLSNLTNFPQPELFILKLEAQRVIDIVRGGASRGARTRD